MAIFSFIDKNFVYDINVDSSAVIGDNTAISCYPLTGFPNSNILQNDYTIS